MYLVLVVLFLIAIYIFAEFRSEEPWPYVGIGLFGALLFPMMIGAFFGAGAAIFAAFAWMIALFVIIFHISSGRIRLKDTWTCALCGLQHPQNKLFCDCGEPDSENELQTDNQPAESRE
jgi:hypothetical protein